MANLLNRSFLISTVGILSSSVIGLVFSLAGLSKVHDLSGFHHALTGVAFLSYSGAGAVTLVLPGLELTLGICLLFRFMLFEAIVLATFLLFIFLIFASYMSYSDAAWTCPCFKMGLPTWFTLSGRWVLARDLGFLILCCSGLCAEVVQRIGRHRAQPA